MNPQTGRLKRLLTERASNPFFVQALGIVKFFSDRSDHFPRYAKRQRQLALGHAGVVAALSLACWIAPLDRTLQAVALGAMTPGAGFLQWAAGDQFLLAVGCSLAGFCLFVIALILWFATGNLIAPVAIWGALAAISARPELFALDGQQVSGGWQFALAPTLAGTAIALAWREPRDGRSRRRAADVTWVPTKLPATEELSIETLQRLRLLLDRALQPAERFDGFEWRDQFQTAAVRYQVNFAAYALALARANYAPAADGYFLEAQQALRVKIGDRRLWRYWGLENAWGNLRLDADPVYHQNIMYSGFAALQLGIGGSPDDLVLHDRGSTWRRYTQKNIARALAEQYARAPYGLLACEPNWIYPLCNIITMAGMRAIDARAGTAHWPALAGRFLDSLDQEATASDGSLIAFRSALTGIAPPAPGGIVMQAFPTLFLSALAPDLAREHWVRIRDRLNAGRWRHLFWPVDVGNYGLSRAAGYAGTAAAAIELGDVEVADKCLTRLEDECRSHLDRGVIHRERASLWAHACELMALCGRPNGLRDLVEGEAAAMEGPRLVAAPYPAVLIAKAKSDGRSLELVLHPGDGAGPVSLEFGGLLPGRIYSLGRSSVRALRSDAAGRAVLRVVLAGRTVITLEPAL